MADYKDYGYWNNQATHAHSYITDPILQLLTQHESKALLDLGCGNGALVNLLIEKDFNAYGTDASETGIEIASKTNPTRFAFQDLSSDDLPKLFVNVKFDTIISTEVIEHLYDPRQFITFCKKILKENGGGQLILTTPYHGYLKNLVLAVAGKWDQHADPLWDGGHIKLWSKNTLTQLLVEQGFRVTDFIGCGRIPYLWKSMIIRAEI